MGNDCLSMSAESTNSWNMGELLWPVGWEWELNAFELGQIMTEHCLSSSHKVLGKRPTEDRDRKKRDSRSRSSAHAEEPPTKKPREEKTPAKDKIEDEGKGQEEELKSEVEMKGEEEVVKEEESTEEQKEVNADPDSDSEQLSSNVS